MIEIRKSHSREVGGCVACTRYKTALGTAAHDVNVYTIGSEAMAIEFRLCIYCEHDLRDLTINPAPDYFETEEEPKS